MLKAIRCGSSAALVLLFSAPVLAQSTGANSAEDVLGPVEDARPLETPASPPPPAPAPETATPISAAPATPAAGVDSTEKSEVIDTSGFALGVALRASTLGFGAELIYSPLRWLNLRAQYNFLDYDRDVEDDDGTTYEGNLDFQTIGMLADWHPFEGSFRISLGAFSNGNQINLKASCPSGCDLGDIRVQSDGADPGRITGVLDFDGFAPYFGFGWGNAMKGWPIHFAFDIGVLFEGEPNVELAARGIADVDRNNDGDFADAFEQDQSLDSDAQVQSEIKKENAELQNDVGEYDMYPVISFTLGYRFGN